jgi:hypothetical protein
MHYKNLDAHRVARSRVYTATCAMWDMRGNAADARDMGSDEDEAGAMHDNAGEVHSDVPGGVGGAGVVHAPVHDVGDMLRTVHATGEVGGNVGNAEDMCGGRARRCAR